jgi:hypothetical protein
MEFVTIRACGCLIPDWMPGTAGIQLVFGPLVPPRPLLPLCLVASSNATTLVDHLSLCTWA